MHKDLDIWKLGIELVEKIYKVTRKFPESERFGLISQLQRAAISYPSNVAEGAARNSVKEYIQFLYISLGSLSEIETQLIIAARLTFMNEDELTEEIEILRRKHLNFIKYLKNKNT